MGADFDFPDLELDHELLALHHPAHYAIETRRVRDLERYDASRPATFREHVVEHQVPHSTALHATLDGGRYLTGPLARYSLNSAQLSPLAREAAAAAGLGATCRNPFRSIVVRAVETVYAIDEALRIIDAYERPEPPCGRRAAARRRRATASSEAPRGAALPPLRARRRRA